MAKDRSLGQEQRQQTRANGRYAKMTPCPRCRRRKALAPAYTHDNGGPLPNTCMFAGGMLCADCINQLKE